METTALAGFVLAALILLLIPGPGVLYVVTRSLLQGRRAGFISVLGLATGALLHVLGAAAGLSAILLTSATAFGIVKLLGAGYLIYLGISSLLANHPAPANPAVDTASPQRIFSDGVIVSLFNPKIALFFLAFIPQFVNTQAGAITLQFFALGLIYVVLAIITDGAYALFASASRRYLNRQFLLGAIPKTISGIVYLGLGMSLALSDRKL